MGSILVEAVKLHLGWVGRPWQMAGQARKDRGRDFISREPTKKMPMPWRVSALVVWFLSVSLDFASAFP